MVFRDTTQIKIFLLGKIENGSIYWVWEVYQRSVGIFVGHGSGLHQWVVEALLSIAVGPWTEMELNVETLIRCDTL